MSQRMYPRNAQARSATLLRSGAQSGPLTFPRNDQSRRDGLAAGMGNAQATVAASGGANACLEAQVVTGGQELILTITGNDRFVNDVAANTALNAAIIAAQAAMGGIKAAMVFGNFALNATGKVLTITLPAVGAYSISANAAYDFVLPAACFKNRAAAVTVTGAINVTNSA